MTENVVEIASRLLGRAVKTMEDHQQWVYEYLDNLQLGTSAFRSRSWNPNQPQ